MRFFCLLEFTLFVACQDKIKSVCSRVEKILCFGFSVCYHWEGFNSKINFALIYILVVSFVKKIFVRKNLLSVTKTNCRLQKYGETLINMFAVITYCIIYLITCMNSSSQTSVMANVFCVIYGLLILASFVVVGRLVYVCFYLMKADEEVENEISLN